ALAQHGPLVDGVAPALAGLAEVIRGHAGDALGRQILIEFEDVGMGPDIGAVEADKDGYVADEANVALGAVVAEIAPLFVKSKLDHPLDGQCVLLFAAHGLERLSVAAGDGLRPGGPRGGA